MDFKESIKTLFDCYKCKSPSDFLISLPVRNTSQELVAWLKPVIKEYRITDPSIVSLLTKWRIENPSISTGDFVPTEERTLRWLDNFIIGRDDRLLFMIEALDGSFLGHIGYSNANYIEESVELDSVLRGVKGITPGLMTFATESLIQWGFGEAKLKAITLSVFSDNEPAIRFYEKLGFVSTHKKPLYRVKLENEEKLELAPEGYTGAVEKYYVYMKYKGALC